MFGIGKTPKPASRPPISAPIPGTGRRFISNPDGSVPPNKLPDGATAMPHGEYPHNRPTPNTVYVPREGGGLQFIKLPQGSTLAEEMPRAHPPREGVDIGTLGWPQNNRDTNRLRQMKSEHSAILNEIATMRTHTPYLSAEEKKSLAPDQLRIRKEALAAEVKAHKQEIHRLEKSERQARRSMEVFESRFSKELRAERDYRAANHATVPSSHGSMLPAEEMSRAPLPESRRPTRDAGPLAKAPGLDAIPERTTPSPIEMPRGAEAGGGEMHTPSRLGPTERRLEELKTEFRTAKNKYHGMKSERALHDPVALETARTRYKNADAALTDFQRRNRHDLRMEGQGHRLPDQDELRAMLHPRTNDNYPAFPAPPLPIASAASMVPPEAIHPGRIARPGAPTPDHPRNRGASPG